jgi:WD40 repeat protein
MQSNSQTSLSMTFKPSGRIRYLTVKMYTRYYINRKVAFSCGGQYFAAAAENTIHIYSSWTLDKEYILRGHESRVRSISWSSNDRKLYSCGLDGRVIIWNTRDGSIVHEFHNPAHQYIHICHNEERYDRLFAVTEEGNLAVSNLSLIFRSFRALYNLGRCNRNLRS